MDYRIWNIEVQVNNYAGNTFNRAAFVMRAGQRGVEL